MMGLFGVYSAAFGTFEEQYGYPVMIAGILAAAISAVELSERFPRARRPITAVCLVFVVAAAVLGIRAEATTDDGFLQVRDWMRTNLPADAKVGVTNSTGAGRSTTTRTSGSGPRCPTWPTTGRPTS